MKHYKLPLLILLVIALAIVPLSGFSAQSSDEPPIAEPSAEQDDDTAAFSYSTGIGENGFWDGINALDCVELFDYKAIEVPSDVHEITGDEVQAEIDSILAYYSETEQVTDRAVKDGDTVNIDYVGSVEDVEFEGGNTGGAGTEVTIGVTSYIDDFLEQLIGHMPGETFDVEVTFPEEYGVEELNGKDAVFVTTVNYIAEAAEPELTDEFVAKNLSAGYGWTTVDEMKDGIAADMREDAVLTYVQERLFSDAAIKSTPEELVEHYNNAMINSYTQTAEDYDMELDEFLSTYVGVAGLDELIETERDSIVETVNNTLVIQAIAEDAGITVTDANVADYFAEYFGTDDYSQYEEEYGIQYLKQGVLSQQVLNYLIDNATLA